MPPSAIVPPLDVVPAPLATPTAALPPLLVLSLPLPKDNAQRPLVIITAQPLARPDPCTSPPDACEDTRTDTDIDYDEPISDKPLLTPNEPLAHKHSRRSKCQYYSHTQRHPLQS